MNKWLKQALVDCPETPWSNGGGMTRELLVWPHNDDWRLRVSVATIAANGPYSALPGVQRWHTILQGSLTLNLDNLLIPLDANSDPLPFAGDIVCNCTLHTPVARAFNVMVKAPFETTVHRLRVGDSAVIDEQPTLHGIGLYTAASTRLLLDDAAHTLSTDQWFWRDDLTASSTLQVQDGELILVRLTRISM